MQCHGSLQFPDSRPRACSHRSLFVRQTPTRPRARGQDPHFTQRLVRSVRCGSRVRQRTLRNLGRHFALPCGDGPALCARVEQILAPQRCLDLEACSLAVEDEAQRSAAQLVQVGVSPVGPAAALPRVDVGCLDLVRPCSSRWACPVRRARRTGSRWPAAAIPRRSTTTVRRSRWAWCWLTDLEAVFRSLGSELGLRPIHHHKPGRSEGHPCLSVLACQLVQVVRQRLRAGGETASWTTLRRRLEGRQRVAAGDPRAAGRGRLA